MNDLYMALAHTVRDRLVERWIATVQNYQAQDVRVVCYLSAEFLIGPHLANNLINLGIYDEAERGDAATGPRPRRAARAGGGAGPRQRRPRPAGRLLPGLAGHARHSRDRLRHPLRVRHLRPGDPRRLAGRADRQVAAPRQPVGDRAPGDAHRRSSFGGHTEHYADDARAAAACAGCRERVVQGVPYDTPILGYGANTANILRLWQREAVGVLRLRRLQRRRLLRRGRGEDRVARTSPRCSIRTTSSAAGKQLRLEQQYFFVSCSLQDMLRILLAQKRAARRASPTSSPIQLNDTHPPIAVAELMRLLVDEHGLDWDEAWEITQRDVRLHQPHAAARGAGEAGRCALFARAAAAAPARSSTRSTAASSTRCGPRFPATTTRVARMSLIDEGGDDARAHGAPRDASAATRSTASPRCTRELLKRDVLRDFDELWPERFSNKTNGVTPRRLLRARATRASRSCITDAHRRRLGDATSSSCASSSRSPTTPRFRDAVARGQARATRRRSPRCIAGPHRHRPSTRRRCSTCRSSASTSTSAST